MATELRQEEGPSGKGRVLVMTFRFGTRPNYLIGEKYCRVCELIHPPEYRPHRCVLCGGNLKTSTPAIRRRLRDLGILPEVRG